MKIKTKNTTEINAEQKRIWEGRKGFGSSAHEFDGQSHLSVAAHVCLNIHCPHLGLVVSYKKKKRVKRCPAGSLLVGSDG